MPDSSTVPATSPSFDTAQRLFDQGVSGVVSMLMVFLAIQIVALAGGAFLGRKWFPDSREKRKVVFDVARIAGVIAGGAFIYFWVTRRGGV